MMNIALLGYGKMGNAIEKEAFDRRHNISLKVSSGNADFSAADLSETDVAIEFSRPEAAVGNIRKCFKANVPVVVGTTGWYDQFEKIKEECENSGNALFYATNFSIGVNLFFSLNRYLAELMAKRDEYEPSMQEIHHTQKLDSPSGTAITLANDLIKGIERKKKWTNHTEPTNNPEELNIVSKRIGDVPGTHSVRYGAEIDEIEITHAAKSRKGFALGAVKAAEWIVGKKGVFTMKDMLGIG